jgi:hypothetical protein
MELLAVAVAEVVTQDLLADREMAVLAVAETPLTATATLVETQELQAPEAVAVAVVTGEVVVLDYVSFVQQAL